MRERFVDEAIMPVAATYDTSYMAAGVEIYIPMRVVANGSGSEAIFTLFRQPDMTDEQFAEDAALVERDLGTLKNILEGGWEGSASSGRAD